MMLTFAGFSALAVDVGSFYVERRQLQSTADLAAVSAASDLARASAAAAATVRVNGLSDTALGGVELGVYKADATVPVGSRFAAGPVSSSNAARVILDKSVPTVFGRILNGSGSVQIRTHATATRTAFASFAIGSRLLAINGGLLNDILSGLTGSTISLTAMDYDALLKTQVDLFSFSNALATRLNVTAGTYSSLLAMSAKPGDLFGALADAATANATAASALRAMSRGQSPSAAALPVSSLAAFGPYGGMGLGAVPAPGASIAVSAFDLATAVAQIANGTRQVEAAVTAGLPAGLASATLRIAIGERPVGTSWITVGQEGAKAHTAQTRVLLTVKVLGSGPTSLLTVPIYVEIASGSAALKALQCGYPNVATSSVILSVKPSVVDAWIGNVSTADFYNTRTAPNPGPAPLVALPPITTVSGRSHVTVSNLAETPLTFSYADVLARTKKTIGTQDFLTSLVTRLLADTTIDVQVLGIGIGIPQGLTSSVSGILAGATQPVDQLLSTVLASMGIGLGQADTWVNGVRCDGAVLVD